MLPPAADRLKLIALLAQLGEAVEEFLRSGLTTTSESTRQVLALALQEAARFRLLRLGSTIRSANEELGRFLTQAPLFSQRRLTFFLSRAWLISRGLKHALESNNTNAYDRLVWSPPTMPLPCVDVVCLGIMKKVVPGSFIGFEFRLRAIADAAPVTAGQRLTWSAIFPLKPGQEVPAEAFLQFPQKQKFSAMLFLDRKKIRFENSSLSIDDAGTGRLSLSDSSTVVAGDSFTNWERFLEWSPEPALERIMQHKPGPLDLETELQEEIVLRDGRIGEPESGDMPGQSIYPIEAGPLSLFALVGPDPEGQPLRTHLDTLRQSNSPAPPIHGLLHYEKCRLVFQPLTVFRPQPEYLTIALENTNKAALLKTLSFR